eukprot:scaffold17068_cov49-Phaeocystis_antarctica.AAC.2
MCRGPRRRRSRQAAKKAAADWSRPKLRRDHTEPTRRIAEPIAPSPTLQNYKADTILQVTALHGHIITKLRHMDTWEKNINSKSMRNAITPSAAKPDPSQTR